MIAGVTPFRSLVLDVDSTVSGIEGIDWLAARRGDLVSRRVADLTQRAMLGNIPLEQVYGTRLAEIRPRREEVDALARAYVDAIAPHQTACFDAGVKFDTWIGNFTLSLSYMLDLVF